MLIVMDKDVILVVSGIGEVIVLDDDFIVIGSGGNYVLSVGCVLKCYVLYLFVEEMVYESLKVVVDICVFINDNIVVEIL